MRWQRTHLPMQETQETRVQSLSWEEPLEEEMATQSSTLAWKIPGRGVAKSRAQPTDFTVTFHLFATKLDVSCGLVLYTLWHVPCITTVLRDCIKIDVTLCRKLLLQLLRRSCDFILNFAHIVYHSD